MSDFTALLKYKTTNDGGRNSPAFSAYHPHMKFPFSDFLTSGQQTFLNRVMVLPGESVKAEISMVISEHFNNLLEVGMPFEFSEGKRVVGTGVILRITNKALEKQPLT